ncbi:MAG: amidohydrolase family protein [Luteitalea sp.]|nr:amidohydrolase family protein [Luteitalea sp.]
MILDINAFIGRWPYWPIPASAPQEVAETLAAAGIDRAAICSTRSVFVHWEDGNGDVERACREHDGRFVPFACLGTLELSHALPPRELDLEAYARRGFRGIRLYPQHHSYHPLYNAFVDRILEDAAARRWPVLLPLRIVMNWGVPMQELPVIEALVARHPRVVWLLAGINYLWELQLAVWLMARYRDVHLETSCVMGYEAITTLVAQCGSDRILFGSGAPIQLAAAGLAKILRARISDADRDAVLGGNARRLLAL